MSVDAWDEAPPPASRSQEAGPDEAPALSGSQVERLFRSQGPRLLRRLSRRVGDDAADLVQESFLRLVRVTSTQPFPDRPEAYLQRIVRNLLADRSKHRAAHGLDRQGSLEEETLPDPAPGPAAVLEARDLASAYQGALNGLRPKTRQIFLLHRCDGFTYAQIGQQIGLSVSGVEKHMMKAIAHIDRVLGRRE